MPTVKGIFGRDSPYPSLWKSPIIVEILSQLGLKSNIGHTHNIADINNLQSTLDNLVIGGGGITAYVHTEASPADIWTINHNKGYKPLIQTFTTGGVEFLADVIHVNENQIQITLGSPVAGFARIL